MENERTGQGKLYLSSKCRLSYQTDFADWTWEEFKHHRLGAAQNCSATLKGNHKLTDVILPETVRNIDPPQTM